MAEHYIALVAGIVCAGIGGELFVLLIAAGYFVVSGARGIADGRQYLKRGWRNLSRSG